MKRRLLIASIALACVWGAWQDWRSRPVEAPPGVLVSEAPLQNRLPDAAAFSYENLTLEPVAAYQIRARLLSRRPYRLGREAKLSPIDFALAWGPMSDSAVLSALKERHGGRFYLIRWSGQPPLPAAQMFSHMSNNHLIPANDQVLASLKRMRPGQVVQLRGMLVNARADDGWRWNTSTVRTDNGAGACELFYVEDAFPEPA